MTKEQKEILKAWVNHKGFELFKENVLNPKLNFNRDAISTIDLWDETERRKAQTIQSDIKAINGVISMIEANKWTVVHNPEN